MRETWVDYAKGVGIILVVFGHVNRGLYNSGIIIPGKLFQHIDNIIYTFHMPLFFFLSGLFFINSINKKTKKEFIANKFESIFYPYAVWSLLQGSIEVLLSKYTNTKTNLMDVLIFPFYPRAQFWFLYALLMIFIFSALIYHHRFFIRALPFLLAISFVLYYFSDGIGSKLHIDYITKNIIFFFFGCLFSAHRIFSKKPLHHLPY